MKMNPPLWQSDLRRWGPALAVGVAVWALVRLLTGQICSLVLLTGLPCPWCGMTRALVALLRPDLAASLQAHPLLLGYLALLALLVLWRYGSLPRRVLWIYGGSLLALTVFVYAFRMATMFPCVSPMTYSSRNLLAWIQIIINKGDLP